MATRFIDKIHTGTLASPTEVTDSTSNRQLLQNRPEAAGLSYDRASKTLKYNGSDEIRSVRSNYDRTITPTAAYTLVAGESGSVVFLNASAGFDITLPSPQAGLNFKFIVGAAFASTNFVVKTAGAAAIIFGSVDVNSTLVPADAEKQINFVASAELPGDWAEVVSDGTNWYVRGEAVTSGGITVTAP